jgi:hypothetical protein
MEAEARSRTIVFVCEHGAAKSVIAAAHCQRLAAARGLALTATAAGTEPDPEIPPGVVAGLLADGLSITGQRPRRVTAEELAEAWQVVALGCDLGDLAGPGVAVEFWDEVPAVSAGFGPARAAIVARLGHLLDRFEGGK